MSKWTVSLDGANAEPSRPGRLSSPAANPPTSAIAKPRTDGQQGGNIDDVYPFAAAQQVDGAG
jgi:hypothetical protein